MRGKSARKGQRELTHEEEFGGRMKVIRERLFLPEQKNLNYSQCREQGLEFRWIPNPEHAVPSAEWRGIFLLHQEGRSALANSIASRLDQAKVLLLFLGSAYVLQESYRELEGV